MGNILFIEFEDGKPFSVVAIGDGLINRFDVEYCKRDEALYADHCGNGSKIPYLEGDDNQWWATDGVYPHLNTHEQEPAPEVNRIERPEAYSDNFEDWIIFSETVYCNICNDRLPAENLCKHVWWDDEECRWSTPLTRAAIAKARGEE